MHMRAARRDDLVEIVRVHDAAFAGFFLSSMGPAFVRAYYGLLLDFDDGLMLVAEDGGDVRGFVAGFGNPAGFYAFMSSRKYRLIVPILRGVLRRPGLLSRILFNRKRVAAEAASPRREGQYILSSIGVNPIVAGRGLGRELVSAFLEKVAERGGGEVNLTTDADDNKAVNAFYLKCGFSLDRTFMSGPKRRMNEYRLEI